jgi:hypothetical protein
MELHFAQDLESKLTHSAAQQNRRPDELVRDVVSRYLQEEGSFVEGARRGSREAGNKTNI